jgi:hypothetical protein
MVVKIILTLRIEVIRSFETLVSNYKSTRGYNTEHKHGRQALQILILNHFILSVKTDLVI